MTVLVTHARRPLARKSTPMALTNLGPDQFEGYASLFGVRDGAGDMVAPGAFAASLRRRGPGDVRLLYQHLAQSPIGIWEAIAEDSRGLHVRGRLSSEVEQARDVRALLADGALNGLSIGFRTLRASRGAAGRTLLEIDLGALSGCSTPPPAAPSLILSAPPSPPASLMTPPRMLLCLKLRPCSPLISAPPGKTPLS